MGYQKPEFLKVSRVDQIDALASNIRFALIHIVINQDGASIREIATQLGCKPSSLYRHVELLVKVGLLRELGTQPTARRDAKIYDVPAKRVRVITTPREPDRIDALKKMTSSMLRHANRETRDGFDSGTICSDGPNWNSAIRYERGWLDQSQLARVRELLDELHDIFDDSPRRNDTQLVALTSALRPAIRKDHHETQ